MARKPVTQLSLGPVIGLVVATLGLLFACGLVLWKTTKFS
jgi:hypothetical protein